MAAQTKDAQTTVIDAVTGGNPIQTELVLKADFPSIFAIAGVVIAIIVIRKLVKK